MLIEDETGAPVAAALLEVRVAEVSLQRTQLEELIQSLSRSRDENQLADIEAAIRVALQQAAITGSAEPLLLATSTGTTTSPSTSSTLRPASRATRCRQAFWWRR